MARARTRVRGNLQQQPSKGRAQSLRRSSRLQEEQQPTEKITSSGSLSPVSAREVKEALPNSKPPKDEPIKLPAYLGVDIPGFLPYLEAPPELKPPKYERSKLPAYLGADIPGFLPYLQAPLGSKPPKDEPIKLPAYLRDDIPGYVPSLQSSPGSKPPKDESIEIPGYLRNDIPSLSNKFDSIDHWRKTGTWDENFSKTTPIMRYLRAVAFREGYLAKLPSEQPPSAYLIPSDRMPREYKSEPYRWPGYEAVLNYRDSYMSESPFGIDETSGELCDALLTGEQTVPENSHFSDDVFDRIVGTMRGASEQEVIYFISRLIVPSARILWGFGADHLKILVESHNAGWNNSRPLIGVRPQPDYSVGFSREAFTDVQLDILFPFSGRFNDKSFIMGTRDMYFPFLTSEVKTGTVGLTIADRQNAHSMTLAVRAVIELFRLVDREKELDRQILAFSVSHDDSFVKIYGHYGVIEDTKVSVFRHPIRSFSFTEMNGKERWTTYKFVRNVYDYWMPAHLKGICSAIDQIPLRPDYGAVRNEWVAALSVNSESVEIFGVRPVLNYPNQPSEAVADGIKRELDDHSDPRVEKQGPTKRQRKSRPQP